MALGCNSDSSASSSLSGRDTVCWGTRVSVGELKPPSQRYCVEAQTGGTNPAYHIPPVPRGSVRTHAPECGNASEAADALNARIKEARAGSIAFGSAVGTYVGGPVGMVVGGVVGEGLAAGIAESLRASSPGQSNCTTLCVLLPPNARNINAYGWMTPIPWKPIGVQCRLGDDNCAASWGAFTPEERRVNPNGTLICTRGKNWSDAGQRQAGLRVEHD